MMYRKLGALGVCAIATGVGLASAPRPPAISFTGLQAGERLNVDYRMSGCFAFEHLTFAFWRANGLQVEVHKWVRGQDGKERRVRLGQTTLNKNDERSLDNLLRFYRTKPGGGCTTIENVQIAHLKGGKELGKEALVDASCSLKPDTLSFGQLGRRFTENKR